MTLTIDLTELDPRDPALVATVGGKGAGLALLHDAGMPVPAGCCVTTTAYRRFVAANGLEPTIRAALDGLITPAELADRFLRAPIPDEAVSYTHLDVYKRQASGCSSGSDRLSSPDSSSER